VPVFVLSIVGKAYVQPHPGHLRCELFRAVKAGQCCCPPFSPHIDDAEVRVRGCRIWIDGQYLFEGLLSLFKIAICERRFTSREKLRWILVRLR